VCEECYRYALEKYGPIHKGDIQHEGTKQGGSGADWWRVGMGQKSSKSDSRKAASALIARIPRPLSDHVAKIFWPEYNREGSPAMNGTSQSL
jgi:hypothetical protein